MVNQIDIIPFQESLSSHFRDLNIAWLQKYFFVEPIDEEILNHPKRHIIDKGGYIFFSLINGNMAGTFALIKVEDTVYELSKMAVDEMYQGKNIGNALMQYCLRKAGELAATKIILYSNTLLGSAIHLYRKYGFVEVPFASSEYIRANIKMEKAFIPNPSLETKKREDRSRIKKLFENKKSNILNVYCTAGYPHLNSTIEVMTALQNSGADLIELGMPYSDPLADGPVIQASSAKALQNGMTIAKLFEQLSGFREKINLPVVLMGYLNPILQYGFEAFCAKAAEVGVDGFIIPDIPMYEYETLYKNHIKSRGLDFIFLVTPETSEERIRKLDALSSGFLYAVSSSSITGSDKDLAPMKSYLKNLQDMELNNPILVGFGIKDRNSFAAVCGYAAGAIVGSAYIKSLDAPGEIDQKTKDFLESILTENPVDHKKEFI